MTAIQPRRLAVPLFRLTVSLRRRRPSVAAEPDEGVWLGDAEYIPSSTADMWRRSRR